MNYRHIKSLGDGNEDSDAVDVKQLNKIETKLINFVLKMQK